VGTAGIPEEPVQPFFVLDDFKPMAVSGLIQLFLG
jgi:hypothetical protein